MFQKWHFPSLCGWDLIDSAIRNSKWQYKVFFNVKVWLVMQIWLLGFFGKSSKMCHNWVCGLVSDSLPMLYDLFLIPTESLLSRFSYVTKQKTRFKLRPSLPPLWPLKEHQLLCIFVFSFLNFDINAYSDPSCKGCCVEQLRLTNSFKNTLKTIKYYTYLRKQSS